MVLDSSDHGGGEEVGEKSGVARRKQRRRSRAPFRLALSGEFEIRMPSVGQVRTGGVPSFDAVTGLVFSLWKNIKI